MVEKKTSTQIAERWDNTDRWVKRVLGVFVTIGTIAGIVAGVTNWVTGQIDEHLDGKFDALTSEIAALRAESEKADKEQKLSTTRLELTSLIAHSAENVVEIERVARYYFVDLGGDWYMSKIYSDWAREYGGDLSFITHVN